MPAGFTERGDAIEKKFQHDSEIEFKIKAKRNRLLGYWAAKQLRLEGPELEAYASKIVNNAIKNPKDSFLITMIFKHFQDENISFTEHQIEKQLLYCQGDAQQEIQNGIAV